MGDTLEFTTSPKLQFYKVTSSALSFEVKSPEHAIVGLAKKPSSTCDFWVIIGCNGRTWIQKGIMRGKTKPEITPNILDPQEYRRFWVSWYGGYVCLGRHGETNPIVRFVGEIPEINYVTFAAVDYRNIAHWKIQLPPVIEKPKIKPIVGGEMRWIPGDAQLPDNSLIGGYEKETLYIIRAKHRGSLTPGKFVPSQGLGYVSWGGASNEKNELEVLCGYNCAWVATTEDKIPVGAVAGGYSEVNRELLYVGRIVHNGHVIPGKVQPSHKVCYVAYEGREVGEKKYEILVDLDGQTRVAHSLLINMNIDIDSDDEYEPDEDDESVVEYDME